MILQTTFTDGQVFFEDLGDSFILTTKQRCPDKFSEISRSHFKGDAPNDCYAMVSPLRRERFEIPIYTDYYYALLSERGCEVMRITVGGL